MSKPMNYEYIYSSSYADMFGCSHRQRVTYNEKAFCQQCGLYITNNYVRSFKTLKMKFNAFFDPLRLLTFAMSPNPQVDLPADYLLIRPKAAERLRITLNTVFLSVNFLDHYVASNSLSEERTYLFAATALMLAAKSSELDEKIPFISKLKRYASMTSRPEINAYKSEEFKNAEIKIIQSLKWNLQRITLIDRVEYFLSFSVLDEEDSLEEESEKKIKDLADYRILEIVKDIESSYLNVTVAILKG